MSYYKTVEKLKIATLTIKNVTLGVVFNEMKGAMSSPVSQLWHHLQATLFPNTSYRFNSGGDPAEIQNQRSKRKAVRR